MTSRVGPKGQVVIPKPMRDALGLRPGDEVEFELQDGGVRVEPRGDWASMRGRFRGKHLTDELMTDRRRERDR
jgi:antitoxin PrlF